MRTAGQLRWNGGGPKAERIQRQVKRGAVISHVARPSYTADSPPRWKDPGNWIDPARVAAFIEQVFNDGPRVATRISA